jgi:hypothetical protein
MGGRQLGRLPDPQVRPAAWQPAKQAEPHAQPQAGQLHRVRQD